MISSTAQTAAYDDYGHGTHVAGIIAGNGYDSGGARAGIAPGARLIVLKVLDANGNGRISDVIAAIDYVVAHKDALNIRVVNLSVATGVYESYNTDPLTLAARARRRGRHRRRGCGGQQRPRSRSGRTQSRRHHGAGQRAVGADRRRVEPHGNGRSRRRHDRRLQLARPDGDRHAAPSRMSWRRASGIESLSDPGSALYSTRARDTCWPAR